jgi:hypothetical protein
MIPCFSDAVDGKGVIELESSQVRKENRKLNIPSGMLHNGKTT